MKSLRSKVCCLLCGLALAAFAFAALTGGPTAAPGTSATIAE